MQNISPIQAILLKGITKIQKMLLRSQRSLATNLYYYLAKLHFNIYFSKDLEQEILNNTEDGYRAAKRHSALVVNTLYKDSSRMARKIARYSSRGSFVKNIILNAKI